jgi:protein-disulfide isomerase
VVYKDWPIFGDMSVYAARLALAAKQQGKYLAIHNALLVTGRKKSTAEQVRDIARDTGIDLKKLDADLASHAQEIDALLKRNDKQAVGMGFEGTPVFLIGPFRVASTLDLAGFEQVVKDARERQTR